MEFKKIRTLFYIGVLFVTGYIVAFLTWLPKNRYDLRRLSIGVKRDHARSERWIVVGADHTHGLEVASLANVPGWKVAVVRNNITDEFVQRLPNVVQMSLETSPIQWKIMDFLTDDNSARKAIGYLYAILYGAEYIYDADDSVVLVNAMKSFHLGPKMWALTYNDSLIFNSYRHFGQMEFTPKGFPNFENCSSGHTYYVTYLNTPLVQQGLVDGDLDTPGASSFARRSGGSKIGFDTVSPPVVLQPGVFAPYASRNVLFHYYGFWSLILPPSIVNVWQDTVRSYWAQRLMWEIGGTIGFFPVNVHKHLHSRKNASCLKRNYSADTKRLILFLSKWRCNESEQFFSCVAILSEDMKTEGFLKLADVDIINAWLQDLANVGYNEPERIKPDLEDTELFKPVALPKRVNTVQYSSPKLSLEVGRTSGEQFLNRLHDTAKYCGKQQIQTFIKDFTEVPIRFPRILLIIIFNFSHYKNVGFIETNYRFHFPNMVFCGSDMESFINDTKSLNRTLSFIQADIYKGYFYQMCVMNAMRMKYSVDGYLAIGDDVLLNTWNINSLPKDRIWLVPTTTMGMFETNSTWSWYSRTVGVSAYKRAWQHMDILDQNKVHWFRKTLQRNTERPDAFVRAASDIVYIPQKLAGIFEYFVSHFTKYNVFCEITIPTVIAGISLNEDVYKLPGTYVWDFSEKDEVEKYFNNRSIFLHPFKVGKEMSSEKGLKFYCQKYFPKTLK